MSRHLISVRNKTAYINVKDGSYYAEVHQGKNRTSPQNRYYHGVIVPMVCEGLRELGNDVNNDETHDILKALFLSKDVELPGGEVLPVPGSTRKLSTEEFNQLIEKIQRWAAEYLSITIPDPGEQIQLKYHD